MIPFLDDVNRIILMVAGCGRVRSIFNQQNTMLRLKLLIFQRQNDTGRPAADDAKVISLPLSVLHVDSHGLDILKPANLREGRAGDNTMP